MKRVIMLLGLVLSVGTSWAQVQSQHLSFNGVSIEGTLSTYVSRMEQNGFTKVDAQDGYALLRGNYAGYKDCFVFVETLKQQDVVSKIAVALPSSDTWSSLSSDYFSLNAMLTDKYGSPADHAEKFLGVAPVDDNAKMEKVKAGKSDYFTTYETPYGSIQLSIERDSKQRCFVRLAY